MDFRNVAANIFPAACLLCKRAVSRPVDICLHCEQGLPRQHPRCPRCAHPVALPVTQCAFCIKKPWRFERCVCLFAYRPPIIQLISEFKYHGRLAVGRTLGMLLAQEIMIQYTRATLPEAVFAVPLHRSRLRERGFNQSLEIAQVLASCLKLKMAHALVHRTHPTHSQVGLSVHARAKNMRHAFVRGNAYTYRSLAVVDDVLTSGASAMATARCLSANTRIHLWCLARAV